MNDASETPLRELCRIEYVASQQSADVKGKIAAILFDVLVEDIRDRRLGRVRTCIGRINSLMRRPVDAVRPN